MQNTTKTESKINRIKHFKIVIVFDNLWININKGVHKNSTVRIMNIMHYSMFIQSSYSLLSNHFKIIQQSLHEPLNYV